MATLLKAKPIATRICEQLNQDCANIKSQGVTPYLKVILVGEHPPSVIYTRNKKKFMEDMGAKCDIINLAQDVDEEEFLSSIKEIADNNDVHGLFVQLPLPKHLQHIDVGQLVPPQKDVDGFHAQNLYQILKGDTGNNALISCTPKGVITMLEDADVDLSGKNVVIIGRSLIVGKPLSMLMTNYNATVTLCHSRTKDLKEVCKKADILVAAIGKAKFVDSSFINTNKKQIIIDVGINHDETGKLCGDVDFDSVVDHCSMISPVPGGVGKMTILSLGQNLLQATKQQANIV